ncbi:Protein MAINTENANCE OF MERISTEMS, partial [Camellia lanceoleosa]
VSSRTTRGYGSIIAREWYAELPEAVRDLVDQAGFGLFCTGISRYPTSRTLTGALVERWWDTTNSFHFSATGDMTMTPFDFVVLTGLDMEGWPIPYDEDMGEWEAAWIYLLGARPPVDRSSSRIRYTWFFSHVRERVPETPEEVAQYTRGFLMFLFGTTLFSDRGNTIGLYLLSALVDLSQVSQYDWGGAGLATLYYYMSATSREQGNIVGGYWRAWEGQYRPRARETLPYLRQFFHTVWPTEFAGGWAASRYRILFEGPAGRDWFLGDRFMRQTMGFPEQNVPAAPPDDMRSTEGLTFQDINSAMLGTDVFLHLEEGEYATYCHTYLMPPLTGVRTPTRRFVGMPSSSRARAAGVPSASRAGTSRGGARLVPPILPTYHHAGWLDIPTKLTGWRYGTSYPIPIEPPMPGHPYVRDPNSLPPTTEYTEGLLGLVASLEGMVLRRETQLSIVGVL